MTFARDLPLSFGDALKAARSILSVSQELIARNVIETESEQLVLAALVRAGTPRIKRNEFYLRLKDRFPDAAGQWLIVNAGARAQGKLLQHLIGSQVFLDHEYLVNADVLVPRPETEALVRLACEELQHLPTGLGLEVGLGSGVLSIELLAKFLELRMIASELSTAAQTVALKNAQAILGGMDRVQVVTPQTPSEVVEPLERALAGRKADFLISNPPYLASFKEADAEVVSHEPHAALFAPSGNVLYFYEKIAFESARVLKEGAPVFLEVPHERSSAILALFSKNWKDARIFTDLAGRDRLLRAILWTE